MNPKMLISAHVDDEVEAPWKSRLDELLTENPEWGAEAQLHRKVKQILLQEEVPGIEASQQAVWSRLQAALPSVKASSVPAFPLRRMGLPTWLAYPAAAAVLALVLGAGFWLGARSTSSTGQDVAELQVQVPAEYHLQLSGDGQLLKVSTLEGGAP